MKYLRRAGLSLAISLLVVSLIGLALSMVTAKTIRNKEIVKAWLNDSGLYSQITNSVLNDVKNRGQENLPSNIDINNPEIEAIINDVFNQNLLKDIGEKLVDGTYAWLEGGVSSPDLAINLSEPKKKLADSLGLYAVQRLQSLPACTPVQLGAISVSSDPLSIQCKPPNINAEQVRQEVTSNMLESLSFLPDNYTNSNNSLTAETSNQGWSSHAPEIYQKTAWIPYLFLFMIPAMTISAIFLSSIRKNGFYRVGGAFITSAISLGIFSLVTTKAPNSLAKLANNNADSNFSIVSNLVTVMGRDIGSLMWWYVGGYLLLGFSVILLAKYLPILNPKPAKK